MILNLFHLSPIGQHVSSNWPRHTRKTDFPRYMRFGFVSRRSTLLQNVTVSASYRRQIFPQEWVEFNKLHDMSPMEQHEASSRGGVEFLRGRIPFIEESLNSSGVDTMGLLAVSTYVSALWAEGRAGLNSCDLTPGRLQQPTQPLTTRADRADEQPQNISMGFYESWSCARSLLVYSRCAYFECSTG